MMSRCGHCSWTGEQSRWTRNLCRRCYEDENIRLLYPTRDGRAMTKEEKSRKDCAVGGCTEPFRANGYCARHNNRFTKHGDPLWEHPNETKRKARKERLEKLALEGLKECFDCGQALPFDSFTSDVRSEEAKKWDHGATGLSTYCRDCQRVMRNKYKEERPWWHNYVTWKSRIKANYGITDEDYCRMWVEQEGKCKICGTSDYGKSSGKFGRECGVFCVDHCHETGNVRGLLCQDCNRGLGCFSDDVTALQRAIDYLSVMLEHNGTGLL